MVNKLKSLYQFGDLSFIFMKKSLVSILSSEAEMTQLQQRMDLKYINFGGLDLILKVTKLI